MLVIDAKECINCGVCVPECPSEAIISDKDPDAKKWLELSEKYVKQWPLLTSKREELADADDWVEVDNKLEHLSPNAGAGS